MEVFPAVISTLKIITSENGWNSESSQKATSLLTAITQCEFLMAFMITKQGFGFIKGLTISLQSHSKDICNAYSEVDNVIHTLCEIREKINSHHKKWYDTATTLGSAVNTLPSIPRRCSRQRGRSNVPANTPEVYYRRSITIPFLDELLSHLNTHFSKTQQLAVKALSIVPSILLQSAKRHFHDANTQLVEDLTKFYEDDVPSSSSLTQELHLWKCEWQSYSGDLPDTPSKALLHASPSMFPNIHCLLRIICTLPVTSCECERSISVLRRLKSYLRSTMGQERLSGLALLHVNYSMELNLDDIISMFARQHPRRMLLTDVLSDET